MAKYTIHGGHAKHGNKYCGAVGYCSESLVDREITRDLGECLKLDGHLIKDCSVDSGISQSNIITQIKKKINAEQNVTANISIHLNASKKSAKDGKTKGVECCVYSATGAAGVIASRICKNVSALGFTNRGIKVRTDLGVLKGIKNGGENVLVECFFCDDEDDYLLYKKLGSAKIAKAIAEGIVGHAINDSSKPATSNSSVISGYTHNGVNYGYVFNPGYYGLHNSDVAKACNNDNKKMFDHFITFGMKEGRKACADFDVHVYMERYIDLKEAYGQNLPEYYKHFCVYGYFEGRKGI